MMRWNGFGRSLVFAAVAAAGLLVLEPLLAPILGAGNALCLFAVGIVPVYLAGLAPSWRRGFVAAVAASVLGGVLLLLMLNPTLTVTGAAAIVAFCRSGILYRQQPLRAVATEALLFAGGLAIAGFLATGGIVSWSLATWGYFLVQSVFFLIGGVQVRRETGPEDPFDRARAELLALLG
jgi:hypothetical protein